MISKANTIEKLQSTDEMSYTAPSLVYHALQAGITRLPVAENSLIASVDSTVIGDPISPELEFESALASAETEHNIRSYFHIGSRSATKLASLGYKVCPLGIETVISLPFSLKGNAKADLRRARNRALKAGVCIREIKSDSFSEFSDRVSKLNQDWFATRRVFRDEFRYLARPFCSLYQPNERRFLAFRGDSIVGLAVYDPIFENGKIVGYFETIARSYQKEIPGVRDLLSLSALEEFGLEGHKKVSLGLSPFAKPQNDSLETKSSPISRWSVRFFFNHCQQLFNCQGLAFHKSRYRGDELPIYYATKRLIPLLSLYHICKISNIDPALPLKRKVNRLSIRFLIDYLMNRTSKAFSANPSTTSAVRIQTATDPSVSS